MLKKINTFFKNLGVAVLCGFWALELVWQHGLTNLRCVFVYAFTFLLPSQPFSFYSS